MRLITFTSVNKRTLLGKPQPIKHFLPEWYRKSETSFVDKRTGKTQHGLKTCVPFLDAMLSGYTLLTPVDIHVSRNEDGTLKLGWNSPGELSSFIGERSRESGKMIPVPAGHLNNHLIWSNEWGIKLPRGWSMLICHPLNRFDLPFTTTAGIIDSDKFWANGNLPFYLKADFIGTIPAGTPIAQLIPIKRAKWAANYDQSLANEYGKQGTMVRQPENTYKKKLWVRKEYR
jgi:hypothetical protein